MRRHVLFSAFALIAAVGSSTASAGQFRFMAQPKAAQPKVVQQAQPKVAQPVAVKAAAPSASVTATAPVDAAGPSVAELRARIAELSKRVTALEAAASEDRRQLINLSGQLEKAVSQPAVRVISVPVSQPTVDYSNDIFPNEYPYGG